ncbi:SOS response-associated peptidase [Brachybacterium huguangmaarense]|uniref:Abasic site processing protein n=1 Tax=Brachybacterium huguangmaarense TaxID=1652028 RepID=A0ABY6FXS6_9MICO|nr:SOS response-associated peptidase [Brachybacterium huguangmaarense]UYG15734.1 SOS response-associated peptidase [Brachybacterium huguangmaarense]
MCGRFAFYQEIEPLVDDLDTVDLADPTIRPRWNIPPTTPIYVVTESIDRTSGAALRALRVARWGLLPSFATDESASARTFNARRETLRSKPSFRGSLSRYRAIVPMDGYYEWRRTAGSTTRQPYYVAAADGSTLYMAALVSWWKGHGHHAGPAASEDGRWLLTATVITRASSHEVLADLHGRTPVMLRRDQVDAWLSPQMDDAAEAQAWILDDAHLLPDTDLALRPVGPEVGSVRHDAPGLLEATGPSILVAD